MCELNPQLTEFYIERHETSRAMIKYGLDTTLNSQRTSNQPTKCRDSFNMEDDDDDPEPITSGSRSLSVAKNPKRQGADAPLLAEGDLVILPDIDDEGGSASSSRSSRSSSLHKSRSISIQMSE